MKRIGVLANLKKPGLAQVLRRVGEAANSAGIDLVAAGRTADMLKSARKVRQDSVMRGVDALMVLGGDGTMLRAARMLDGRDIPLIGVKIGGLGFLTSVTEERLGDVFGHLAAKRYSLSKRVLADCVVKRRGKTIAGYRAFNDVVIHNGESGRVITLELSLDREQVSPYICDGIIISTPTGSTGHSLSAGGPIVKPGTAALVIGFVCPHTLSSRPLVVPDTTLISVVVANSSGPSRLSVDGQVGQALKDGDKVEVKQSRKSVKLVQLPDYSYVAVLRQKLHWRGSNV